jgi:hypothetical protein
MTFVIVIHLLNCLKKELLDNELKTHFTTSNWQKDLDYENELFNRLSVIL